MHANLSHDSVKWEHDEKQNMKSGREWTIRERKKEREREKIKKDRDRERAEWWSVVGGS